jgi:hypothetical protein
MNPTPEVEAWKDPYWLKLKEHIKICIDGYACMSCDMNMYHPPRKHDDDCFLIETEAFILKMLNNQTALQSRVKELESQLAEMRGACQVALEYMEDEASSPLKFEKALSYLTKALSPRAGEGEKK